jgi:hypothetical protein
MGDIRRIKASMIAVSQNAGNPYDAEYVTYHDHVAAVAAAEQRVTDRHNAEQGGEKPC